MSKPNRKRVTGIAVCLLTAVGAICLVQAGDLEPPGAPAPTMVTLQEIYNRVSASPVGVPKTGQTGCWNQTGIPIACAGTGQDGEFQNGVSVSPRSWSGREVRPPPISISKSRHRHSTASTRWLAATPTWGSPSPARPSANCRKRLAYSERLPDCWVSSTRYGGGTRSWPRYTSPRSWSTPRTANRCQSHPRPPM